MKYGKLFILFLVVYSSLLCNLCCAQGYTIADVVGRVPFEDTPFTATKKTPFLRRLNYTIDNSSGVIPSRLYKDVQCKQFYEASDDQGAEFFRKFTIPNSTNVLMDICFGGVTDWQTHLLCVVNPIGNVINTLDASVLYYPSIAVKQYRINAQSQVIVSTLVPTSYTPIMFEDFTSFEAQRVDVTYDINAQGQFVQIAEAKFAPRVYTRAYLESRDNDIWNGGESLMNPTAIDPTKPALEIYILPM